MTQDEFLLAIIDKAEDKKLDDFLLGVRCECGIYFIGSHSISKELIDEIKRYPAYYRKMIKGTE